MIITGGDNLNLAYLNPISLYWSIQHASYDKDNLLMGFDFDYQLNKNRIYGAFSIDEWRPENTLNQDSRNWFGFQLGYSRFIKLFNISNIFKIEYSKLNPQLYAHYLDRNLPQHHNYNLGFWAGGHSEEIALFFTSVINNYSSIHIKYLDTKKGNSSWGEDINFSPDLWNRKSIQINYKRKHVINLVDLDFGIKYLLVRDLYNLPEKISIECSLNYNFDY